MKDLLQIFFFFKPNPQNFTNYIWFLNYVFTRNKKLELCSTSESLFQPVMKYQRFQRGDKKLIHNSFAFCAMLSPVQEKTVTIWVEYEVHAVGICWWEPLWSWRLSPGKKRCWKEEAQQELITEFTILILEGAGQGHWFALGTILGLDSGRLDLTLGCVGYPAGDNWFSHSCQQCAACNPSQIPRETIGCS